MITLKHYYSSYPTELGHTLWVNIRPVFSVEHNIEPDDKFCLRRQVVEQRTFLS